MNIPGSSRKEKGKPRGYKKKRAEPGNLTLVKGKKKKPFLMET